MAQPEGLSLSALGSPPALRKLMSEITWPRVYTTGVASVNAGAVVGGAGALTVMLTVAELIPPALVAVTVAVTALVVVAVGVPVMRHDKPLTVRRTVRLAGKPVAVQPRGVSLSALGAPPLLAKVMSGIA